MNLHSPYNLTLEPLAAFGEPDGAGMPQEVQDAIATLRKARSEAADQVERLLSFLDETELDYEENEIDAVFRARFGPDPLDEEVEEREPEPEHDELTGDEEPSLGASESIHQGSWGACESFSCDLELDSCDMEPSLAGVTVERGGDRDLEADLGSFDRMVDQRKASRTTAKHRAVEDGEHDGAPMS